MVDPALGLLPIEDPAMREAPPRAPRRELDRYYTPDAVAQALVPLALRGVRPPLRERALVIEPSVGGGAWVRAVRRWAREQGAPNPRVHGYDLDMGARGRRDVDTFLGIDWPTARVDAPVWAILGNPPYAEAEAHVAHALDQGAEVVGMLLRLAFVESARRLAWWEAAQASMGLQRVWVLAERPSFTGGSTDSAAYAWFVWRRRWAAEPRMQIVSWRTGAQPLRRSS